MLPGSWGLNRSLDSIKSPVTFNCLILGNSFCVRSSYLSFFHTICAVDAEEKFIKWGWCLFKLCLLHLTVLKLPNYPAKMLEVTQSSGGGREGGRTEKPCWKFFYCPVLINIFHSNCELTINSMLIISCSHRWCGGNAGNLGAAGSN